MISYTDFSARRAVLKLKAQYLSVKKYWHVDQRTSQINSHSSFINSYYAVLGLKPWASSIEIRRTYRELSKRYHPDTTELPGDVATSKFQQLNEAYATLSNPEKRAIYDLKIGYSRWNVIQVPTDSPDRENNTALRAEKSAYLDATDRDLSAGEIFVLLILGLTFLLCLGLVFLMGYIRGDELFH